MTVTVSDEGLKTRTGMFAVSSIWIRERAAITCSVTDEDSTK